MATPSSGKFVPKASLTSFIKGETFKFIVGPEKTQYCVHVEALKAISEPLGYLMTNGKMEESIKGEAALPEVEPEIFEQLVKFAYQGLCGMADNLVGDHVTPAPSNFCCHTCRTVIVADETNRLYPFCSDTCQSTHMSKLSNFRKGYRTASYCVVGTCGVPLGSTTSAGVLCVSHDNAENRMTYPEVNTSRSDVKAERFYSLNYSIAGLPHTELRDHLEKHKVYESSVVPPIHHAKLYALATQYLIQDLKYVCLHKLHRHLANFKITADEIDELADLLTYTYSNTEDGGDILKAKSDPLRRLVMIYIAENSSTVLKNEGFREVLGAGGAHTADFMALKYT